MAEERQSLREHWPWTEYWEWDGNEPGAMPPFLTSAPQGLTTRAPSRANRLLGRVAFVAPALRSSLATCSRYVRMMRSRSAARLARTSCLSSAVGPPSPSNTRVPTIGGWLAPGISLGGANSLASVLLISFNTCELPRSCRTKRSSSPIDRMRRQARTCGFEPGKREREASRGRVGIWVGRG